MMLYSFVKKDGNVIRVGAECDVPQPLQDVHLPYSESGHDLATAEEWDAQMLKEKPIEAVSEPVEAPAEEPKVEEAPVE